MKCSEVQREEGSMGVARNLSELRFHGVCMQPLWNAAFAGVVWNPFWMAAVHNPSKLGYRGVRCNHIWNGDCTWVVHKSSEMNIAQALHTTPSVIRVTQGLHATPSKKCHEKGLSLGRENLNFAWPISIQENVLHQSRLISESFFFLSDGSHRWL